MLKVGILGCGKIAQVRHIPEYLDNINVQIVGYYSRNIERANQMVEMNGGIAYSSYEELLSNPEIDAVSVCTANSVHAEMTIAALKAGKHVLCEKPMATSLADCEEMVKIAKETNKVLVVGHNQRFAEAHVIAKSIIKDGTIGDVISFRTIFGHKGPETWSINPGRDVWFFDKDQATMGVLGDLGIHKTDLMHYLFDDVIVETTAVLSTLNKRGSQNQLITVDDEAMCIYKFRNGVTGTMTASWNYYGPEDNSTIIYGTKGVIRIYEGNEFSIKVNLENEENIYYGIGNIQTNKSQTKSGVIDDFVGSILSKKVSMNSGQEALKTMRVIFKSIESSNLGKKIIISQI